MNILTSENLYKKFPIQGGNAVCAVNGVNLEIEEGKTLGLVGESGCGKSTIGRMIMRLTDPSAGHIFYQGIDLFKQKASENLRLRRDIQIVFQDPYSSLNPRKHVKYTIEEPMILTGIGNKEERHAKVVEMLKMVELDESYLNKYPIELTQGEQQRIGVARAFVTNPKIIVLDEPTSLLDIRFRGEIVLLLRRLQKELGCAYLFISHDLNVVYQLSHKVNVMYLGRIVEQGDVDTLFHNPMHPYSQALLNATLLPDPEQPKHEGFFLEGEVPSPINLPDGQCNFAPRCPYAGEACHKRLPELEARNGSDTHKVACFYPPKLARISSGAASA